MPTKVALMPATAPTAHVEESTQSQSATARARQWALVVHDDPINTMNYVEWVFRSHFGFPSSIARHHMLRVHNLGRSVLATGTRERMEIDVTAMHSYGLRATIEPQGEDEDA